MRVRPPADPVAHLPRRRPRDPRPHWIDRVTVCTLGGMVVLIIASAATQGH